MVEQASKEEATSSDTHGGESGDKKTLQGGKAFKKKNSKGSYAYKKIKGVPELRKGASFSISRDDPDMYLKAVKSLGPYVYTSYKNGSDVQLCLDVEELILPKAPILPENPLLHQKNVGSKSYCSDKNEELLKQKIRLLYVVMVTLLPHYWRQGVMPQELCH